MKKLASALLVFLSCLLIFCHKESDEDSNPSYAGTILGGCNGQKSLILKNAVNEKDTILFSVKNDTLHIFAGLNYTCCAPFETSTTIKGDSILLIIRDNCPGLQSCYCKCMCYYTFDFRFIGFNIYRFPYKITLIDPRQGKETIFRQGWFELTI